MEDQGVKLEKRPEETPAIDTAEADRLRVLEEKKARREAAAKLKRKKIRRKRLITSVITLAVIGGIAFGMMQLFKEKKPELTIWSQPVMRGSISSSVTGSGETKALKSATLTLSSGGTVQEVYVQEGQQVKEGDPLYKVDSTEAQKAVEDAQKTVNDYQKQIDALNKSYADLTFTAPFTGKLIDAPDLKVGNTIASGEKLGKLVDDNTMKLSLYFSYAYEQEFSVGKTATISIPTTMTNVTGTVETINKVQRISPEGSKLFEVIFTMKNPGTLTEGMGATASLKASDGSEIFAYEPGTLTYNRSVDLTTKAGGELIKVNLVNYSTVQSGTVLVQMKGDNNDDQMASLSTSLADAQANLKKAQESLAKYNAVSPITGTVLSVGLQAGQTVPTDTTAVSIADTSIMTVEIKVDSMNVSYVKAGMPCDIIQYDMMTGEQRPVTGTVTSVSLEGKNENGTSYFPATIQVENPDGELRPGMYVEYSMTASQADDCLLVPLQAVKQTQLGTCVFVEGEPTENALDPAELGMEVPEGYYAVAVTIGLSDQANVEIKEGLEEGQNVFIQYMTNEGSSWDTSGGMGGGVVIMG